MSLSRFDMTAGNAPEDAASLLYISSAKYDQDWHSILHSHGFTELFYVVGGRGQFQIRTTTFPVGEGDMVIVEPNVEHTETSLDASPLEYIVLGIDGFALPVASQEDQLWQKVSFQGSAPDIMRQLRGILRETEEKSPGYETVCQSLVNILLVQLSRRIGFATGVAAPRSASREGTAARRYIDNHFRENLTLDSLAQAVHISKYHLAHIFTREYGISPISYLQELRLQECRDLLRTTDYSVAQVARMTGFSSPSYFSQRFHKAEGMSPAQYRQKHQKK